MYGTYSTEHDEAPLNLFCCCFMPIWAPTMVQRVQNSGWGFFHGGCRRLPGKTGDFWPRRTYMGVRVRTTLWPQLEISPMHQPTIIHRPTAPNLGIKKSGGLRFLI